MPYVGHLYSRASLGHGLAVDIDLTEVFLGNDAEAARSIVGLSDVSNL